jgi:hypothetical protein
MRYSRQGALEEQFADIKSCLGPVGADVDQPEDLGIYPSFANFASIYPGSRRDACVPRGCLGDF